MSVVKIINNSPVDRFSGWPLNWLNMTSVVEIVKNRKRRMLMGEHDCKEMTDNNEFTRWHLVDSIHSVVSFIMKLPYHPYRWNRRWWEFCKAGFHRSFDESEAILYVNLGCLSEAFQLQLWCGRWGDVVYEIDHGKIYFECEEWVHWGTGAFYVTPEMKLMN